MLRTTTFTVAMMALAGILAANVEHEASAPDTKAVPASADLVSPIHLQLPEGGAGVRKSVVHQRRQMIAPTSSKPSVTTAGGTAPFQCLAQGSYEPFPIFQSGAGMED